MQDLKDTAKTLRVATQKQDISAWGHTIEATFTGSIAPCWLYMYVWISYFFTCPMVTAHGLCPYSSLSRTLAQLCLAISTTHPLPHLQGPLIRRCGRRLDRI